MTEPGDKNGPEKEPQAGLTESAHRIWLAGLGAVALAQETGGKMFADLVKRGRDMEEQTKLPDLTATLRKASDRTKEAVQHLGKEVDEQVAAALHRLGVPTRDEIATLSQRVEALTAAIGKLKPNAPQGASPPAESEPQA